MKLSEYIGDLQAMLELYGDYQVLEEREHVDGVLTARTAVRSPRLRVIASRNAANTLIHWAVPDDVKTDPRPRCYVI